MSYNADMPEYALILTILLVVTVFLHTYFKVKIYKSRIHFVALNGIILLVGIIWDNFAIARGHWSFGEQFLLGPRLGFMPIEEYGFAIIVVYFCLVVYKITEKRFNR
jgi:lycopene cyclase domain-containing protein